MKQEICKVAHKFISNKKKIGLLTTMADMLWSPDDSLVIYYYGC